MYQRSTLREKYIYKSIVVIENLLLFFAKIVPRSIIVLVLLLLLQLQLSRDAVLAALYTPVCVYRCVNT